MTWDVLLLRLPEGTASLRELPADFAPIPLGPRDLIARALSDALPALEPLDASLAVVREEDFVVELELGPGTILDHVLVHVLGSDAAYGVLRTSATALGASAVDCESDEVLDLEAPTSPSLRSWQARFDEIAGGEDDALAGDGPDAPVVPLRRG